MKQMNQASAAELLNLIESQNPDRCYLASEQAHQLLNQGGARTQLTSLPKDLFEPEHYDSEHFAQAISKLIPQPSSDSEASSERTLLIIGESLAALSEASAIEIVAALRNRLNAKMILLQCASFPLGFHQLLGLGFKREFQSPPEDDAVNIFSYDIASYNKKRDWNNSRFWANPQNFEKYRW
jgi:uncharacterized protein DUF6231